jgi:AP-1 complex subunit gamma-1
MLVTNSIKNDINNINQYVSGIALCALGNIGNHEMCLGLSQEIQNQLSVENPLIRKKAALCALRIVKKVDDIEDKFNSRIIPLIEDKNHGVVLAACSLLIHLLEKDPSEYLPQFKSVIPILFKHLRTMLMSGYTHAPEYDFGGIVDPFLQVKILHLIRIFAQDPAYISPDELNDILAQIATNTDGSKNSGNAVLYECVRTIMSIKADSGLRVLGVNILGKFLQNKDNNIRYVALQMLQQVVAIDRKAVSRHKTIVLECLNDPDISIRKRSLEVIHALINADNIDSIVPEMITQLIRADAEFKSDLASRICMSIDKFAPTKRYQIDQSIRVLLLAGNHVNDEQMFTLCHVIAATPELHQYAVNKLFYALADIDVPESLVLVSVWILGEYGDLLVKGGGPSFADVLDLFEEVIRRAVFAMSDQAIVAKNGGRRKKMVSSVVVCEYTVSAVVKLFIKLGGDAKSRVEKILNQFSGSLSVELQQRVSEYTQIINSWDESTRGGLFDTMPPSETSFDLNGKNRPVGSVDLTDAVPVDAQAILADIRGFGSTRVRTVRKQFVEPTSAKRTTTAGLIDLDDLLGEATVMPQQPAPVTAMNNDDLLKDIFG